MAKLGPTKVHGNLEVTGITKKITTDGDPVISKGTPSLELQDAFTVNQNYLVSAEAGNFVIKRIDDSGNVVATVFTLTPSDTELKALDVNNNTAARHTHGNSAVLDATTDPFTTADRTKLNGIEPGATADQTATEILTAIKTVDGSGSGLDADTLDGLDSTAFAQLGVANTFTELLTASKGVWSSTPALTTSADLLSYTVGTSYMYIGASGITDGWHNNYIDVLTTVSQSRNRAIQFEFAGTDLHIRTFTNGAWNAFEKIVLEGTNSAVLRADGSVEITGDQILSNLTTIKVKDSLGTARNAVRMDGADRVSFGDVNSPTILRGSRYQFDNNIFAQWDKTAGGLASVLGLDNTDTVKLGDGTTPIGISGTSLNLTGNVSTNDGLYSYFDISTTLYTDGLTAYPKGYSYSYVQAEGTTNGWPSNWLQTLTFKFNNNGGWQIVLNRAGWNPVNYRYWDGTSWFEFKPIGSKNGATVELHSNSIALDNNQVYYGADTGGTARRLLSVDTLDKVIVANTTLPTVIRGASVKADIGAGEKNIILDDGSAEMTGALVFPNNIGLKFKNVAGTPLHLLFMSNVDIVTLGNSSYELRLRGNKLTYYDTALRTVWHSGNDGPGSGLDADKVDGINANTVPTANNLLPLDSKAEFPNYLVKNPQGSDSFTFEENFDYPESVNYVVNRSGTGGGGTFSIVPQIDSTGSNALVIGDNLGNDDFRGTIGTLDKAVPLSPDDLYEIEYRVRQVAGTGACYLGVAGIKSDKTTPVNTTGLAVWYSQHYVCAANVVLPTTWTTYRGYFRGKSATGNGGPATSPTAPATIHSDAQYVVPFMYANYNSVAGQVEVDYVRLRKIGASVVEGSGTEVLRADGSVPATGNQKFSGGVNPTLTTNTKGSSAVISTYPDGITTYYDTTGTNGWPAQYVVVFTVKTENNIHGFQIVTDRVSGKWWMRTATVDTWSAFWQNVVTDVENINNIRLANSKILQGKNTLGALSNLAFVNSLDTTIFGDTSLPTTIRGSSVTVDKGVGVTDILVADGSVSMTANLLAKSGVDVSLTGSSKAAADLISSYPNGLSNLPHTSGLAAGWPADVISIMTFKMGTGNNGFQIVVDRASDIQWIRNCTADTWRGFAQIINDLNTPVVTQTDAEAGTSTTPFLWTPQRVNQAIQSLAPAGGGGGAAGVWEYVSTVTPAAGTSSLTLTGLDSSLYDYYIIFKGLVKTANSGRPEFKINGVDNDPAGSGVTTRTILMKDGTTYINTANFIDTGVYVDGDAPWYLSLELIDYGNYGPGINAGYNMFSGRFEFFGAKSATDVFLFGKYVGASLGSMTSLLVTSGFNNVIFDGGPSKIDIYRRAK